MKGMIDFAIAREEHGDSGQFFIEHHGRRVAELRFSRTVPSTAVIEYVGVDLSLRGRGVAKRLVDAAVEWARDEGISLRPACSYAAAQFDRDPSIQDVLADG
jgi:predicted GNAT family acetyltransferase